MTKHLRRRYGSGILHCVTCSCYWRLPLLGSARSRDLGGPPARHDRTARSAYLSRRFYREPSSSTSFASLTSSAPDHDLLLNGNIRWHSAVPW
jgi:hypothetical protein